MGVYPQNYDNIWFNNFKDSVGLETYIFFGLVQIALLYIYIYIANFIIKMWKMVKKKGFF